MDTGTPGFSVEKKKKAKNHPPRVSGVVVAIGAGSAKLPRVLGNHRRPPLGRCRPARGEQAAAAAAR